MMILIIGFTCPPTINFKFITKCDNCYYKVRQLILLQSATAFLLQSAATVITKRDRYYKVRQNTVLSKVIFFFFSGFILVLCTRLAEFILHTNYLSRRIIRLEFDENLSRYFTRVAKI